MANFFMIFFIKDIYLLNRCLDPPARIVLLAKPAQPRLEVVQKWAVPIDRGTPTPAPHYDDFPQG
jgi:hypothetical protein